MQTLRVCGPNRLVGSLRVHGSKNGSLPILAASLLCGGETVLFNLPRIDDTAAALEIFRALGGSTRLESGAVVLCADGVCGTQIPDDLMQRMRSSVIFLGAILARTGEASLCCPGGCRLGPRPIDMHLAALAKLGVEIRQEGERLYCRAERLRGASILLPFPSVGATENLLLAACTAQGETLLQGAACEPEIIELAAFLNACGARIYGAGGSTIRVEGVPQLHGCTYRLEGDRIVAATYLAAAAVTGGDVELCDFSVPQIACVQRTLEKAGCLFCVSDRSVRMRAPDRLQGMGLVCTLPYPGFPTDAQAVLMAAAAKAEGVTRFEENIFSERYKHCAALTQMGARIRRFGRTAVVEGVGTLHGAEVTAVELRGGAALVLAALAAEGQSVIHGCSHICRGYENIAADLQSLGGQIAWNHEYENKGT